MTAFKRLAPNPPPPLSSSFIALSEFRFPTTGFEVGGELIITEKGRGHGGSKEKGVGRERQMLRKRDAERSSAAVQLTTNLHFHLRSHSHLWSQASGRDPGSKSSITSSLKGGQTLPSNFGEELCHPGELQWENSCPFMWMARSSQLEAPQGTAQGLSHWHEASVRTQGPLEGRVSRLAYKCLTLQ